MNGQDMPKKKFKFLPEGTGRSIYEAGNIGSDI